EGEAADVAVATLQRLLRLDNREQRVSPEAAVLFGDPDVRKPLPVHVPNRLVLAGAAVRNAAVSPNLSEYQADVARNLLDDVRRVAVLELTELLQVEDPVVRHRAHLIDDVSKLALFVGGEPELRFHPLVDANRRQPCVDAKVLAQPRQQRNLPEV